MSACAAGSARATLAVAVRYGGHRMISGSRGAPQVPVNAHRTHHGPLASAMATVFAMSLLYRRAQERWESLHRTRTAARRPAALVDVAKAWITWRAREVIVESRERCGAQALLENNGMTELVTGVEGAITAEGDNIALYAKAAADMLFAAEPGRDDVPGPAARPGDLADPRFLGGLLASVQDIWFARARARALRAPDADALGRWNAASGPALRGVEACAYRQAAEAYRRGPRAALPEGAARERLGELERLFAVEWVARNSGDLLAAGLLSGDQVESLPEAVEELVAAVAAHAPELADSFALPERLLADWPIAGPGYADAYDDPAGPWNAGPGGRPDERPAARGRRPVGERLEILACAPSCSPTGAPRPCSHAGRRSRSRTEANRFAPSADPPTARRYGEAPPSPHPGPCRRGRPHVA